MFLLVILVPSVTHASMSCGPRGSQNLLTNYEMEKPYLQWFQSSADPSSLLQSKNIAHTFLAVKTRRAMPHTFPQKRTKEISISLHRISPQQQNTKKNQPNSHTNHQTCCFLLLSHSISLLATPLNLHGHSQHRHPALLSPQTPTFGIGETVRLTSRYYLLGMYLLEIGDTLFSVLLRANGEKQKQMQLLALACIISGLNNYIKTVNRYSRREALVQSGWGTQVVFTVVASAIVAACVLFLSTQAGNARE